jgi:hypothetical protein
MTSITKSQMIALQAFYAQHARRSLDATGDPRATRLQWASEQVGRRINSFSDLSKDEAQKLIDVLAKSLGQGEHRRRRPRHRNRDRAHAAGTEGRRGSPSSSVTLVSAEDLARIDDAITRLGWTRERFDAWLRSSSSPLGQRAEIRTLGDANKVWWPMKAMLKRVGKWRSDDENGFEEVKR